MQFSHEVRIDAPPERVWEVLREIETWPQWTPTMDRVELLDNDGLTVDARVRIKQPRLPTTVWRISRLEHGRGFDWEAGALGATTTAGHWISASTADTSTVTLSIETRGILAWLSDLLTRPVAGRYVPREAAGLKARCEEPTP